MFHHQQRHLEKGHDPTDRGGRKDEISSSILTELQNIESEIQKTILERSKTSNNGRWTRTPPSSGRNNSIQPTQDRYSAANRNNSNNNKKEDPPLTAEKYATYCRQHQEEDDDDRENTYQKTPTVRFSEQLEIYTKQKSQRAGNELTPTIPILRPTTRTATPYRGCETVARSPGIASSSSSGGGGNVQSSSCRDPTPRSAERISDDNRYQRREPAGTTTHLSFCPSDPPLDRSSSRHNMMAPSFATNKAPARPSSAEPLPLQKGALSLQNQTGGSMNLPPHLIPKTTEKTNDVELNPRRLSSDFALTHRQTSFRKDLAPTPTNRHDEVHKELAPTPNYSSQRNKKEADEWTTATPPLRNPDQVPSPTDWNVAELFSPTLTSSLAPSAITSEEHWKPQSGMSGEDRPPKPTLPTTLPLPPSHPHYGVGRISTPTSDDDGPKTPYNVDEWGTTSYGVNNNNNDDDDDSRSELSTESVSAYLINKYTKKTMAGRGKPNKYQQYSRNLSPSSEASSWNDNNDIDVLSPPATTPNKVLPYNGLQRMAVSDSKIYEKSCKEKDGATSIGSLDKRKQSPYLQLNSNISRLYKDGSNVPTFLPIVPKHIDVQMETDLYSVGSTVQEEVVKVSQQQTTPTAWAKDRLGNVLKRLRSPRIPFQNLTSGTGFSYDDESYAPRQRENYKINNNNSNSLLQQGTIDTIDSHSSDVSRSTSNSTSRGGSKWGELYGSQDTDSYMTDTIGLLAAFARNKRRNHRMGKTSMVWLLVCTVIICLAAGLPTYFIMTKKEDDGGTQTTATTSSPDVVGESKTFQDCSDYDDGRDGSFSDRYATIRQYLRVLSVSSTSDMDTPGSAQRKALCWIAEFDGYNIDVSRKNTDAIIQRYSLAVLYYSWMKEDGFSEEEGDTRSHGLGVTDFLSSTHECDWDVMMCDLPGTTVTALLLSDKDLHGSVPVEIGNLVGLESLELSLNQITGTIPSSVQQLTSLQYFAIAFNELTDASIPTVLGRMTSLQALNMKSSQIRGTVPTELGQLAGLRTLSLEGNLLSGSIPSTLGNLHNAEQMNFVRNYISGKVPIELCELRTSGQLSELIVDHWVDCICCSEE